MRPSIALVSLVAFLHLTFVLSKSISIPPIVSNSSSVAQFISDSSFDGPKVTNINASSYDWWYFDAVSLDSSYSIVVVFYAAPTTSFFGSGSATNILETSIRLQTPGADVFAVVDTLASGATLSLDGNDIAGEWEGTGSTFSGVDLSRYTLAFDTDAAKKLGISGFISMSSIAPPHYPCSPAEVGVDMTLVPHVGWANAIPDAETIVALDINGTTVSFVGSGYHDKNWGDVPFNDAVSSWYWGHGRVGPYSIVWFDGISINGTEITSGYVSENGRILGLTCGTNNVQVRPINATYPPDLGSDPQGFTISIDVEDRGVFTATVMTEHVLLAEEGAYMRWSGSISGGFRGSEQIHSGSSLFEQFTF